MTNESDTEDNPQVTRILDLSREDPARLHELEQFRRPITVLFADIVGSTSYFEEFGDLAGLAMVHHSNRLLRQSVEQFAGSVIKNIGDANMATFEDAQQGVLAAIELQRRLKELNANKTNEHRFAIRIGLHYGAAIVRSNKDVFGDVVNVAARIQRLAQPEQILVSDAVCQKIEDAQIRLRPLGLFQLKGKSEERDLFEVLWEPASGARRSANSSEDRLEFLLCPLTGPRVAQSETVSITDGLTIGRDNADLHFPDCAMDSPHARFSIVNGQPVIEDLSAKQGIFLQIIGPHILRQEDIMLMGSRFFLFHLTGPTAYLVQIDIGKAPLAPPFPLIDTEVRLGRSTGDLVFPDDSLMSRTHARLYRQGNQYLLEDLASRNGTFIKVVGKGRVPLKVRIWMGGKYFCVV